MKKTFIAFVLIFLTVGSCKAPAPQPETKKEKEREPVKEEEPMIVRTLWDFFKRAEIDIANADAVIVNKDMVKNLSHLQFMNHGGRKYYLLERENISEMIRAVTVGVYHDFILINNDGKIIYTMRNDDIFGKNVKTQLKDTSYWRCFINRNRRLYFDDVSGYLDLPGDYYIFVSSEVKGNGSFPGIFILQFEISKLRKFLDSNTSIVNPDCIYKINAKSELINKPHEHKDRLAAFLLDDHTGQTLALDTRRYISFRHFTYENISWFILTDKTAMP